ncbi:MFS transporter [Tsukamurella soli]|uniref:MFS transporter n=3 Tax=Tsukamurella soli TaxID=644556 RepID=A0ABP8KGR1_9ACTN
MSPSDRPDQPGRSDRPQYTSNHHLPPLGETPGPPPGPKPTRAQRMPRKLTVTRVAALRGRELAGLGVAKWHQAARADGAHESGLTALTYPVILNNAVDAALMVALANTLFFAATKGQDVGKVMLYLLVNIAPFAVIAPFMGPLIDRIQHGRRIALAVSFVVRVALAAVLIGNCAYHAATNTVDYNAFALYPCALGMMVMSKSFSVLKSAVTPRVLPPTIDLARVNSRLTLFGLVVGTGVGGGIATALEFGLGRVAHVPGAVIALMFFSILGVVASMRIPKWVENTSGEVPTKLTYTAQIRRTRPAPPGPLTTPATAPSGPRGALKGLRAPLGRNVVTGLWANVTVRFLTGFLTLFVAFYAKNGPSKDEHGLMQLAVLGAVGAAAGVGNFLGNAVGARLELGKPSRIATAAALAATVGVVTAAALHNLLFAAIATFVGSAASAIAKVCLDASIQDDLPDESRASAFGLSETALQLGWVFGAALGVLLPHDVLWIGFTTVAAVMVIGTAQTVLTYRGASLVPGLGGRRPVVPHTESTAPFTSTAVHHEGA